jgi:hypothetical protein
MLKDDGLTVSHDAVFAVLTETVVLAEELTVKLWVVAPPFSTLLNRTCCELREIVATDCARVPS